jgi:hypothetical protein
VHYELGYRLRSEVVKHGRYSTPYFEFARTRTQGEAGEILRQMEQDFPQAEFRAVQCFKNTQERLRYFGSIKSREAWPAKQPMRVEGE